MRFGAFTTSTTFCGMVTPEKLKMELSGGRMTISGRSPARALRHVAQHAVADPDQCQNQGDAHANCNCAEQSSHSDGVSRFSKLGE